MKNKLMYFFVCLGIYLSLYFVEEIIIMVAFTILSWTSIVHFYLVIGLLIFINPWITWKVANYIDRKYLTINEK